jgi:hypothetical protein
MTHARNAINQALEMISLGKSLEAIDFLKSEIYWDLRSPGDLRIIVRFLCATLDSVHGVTESLAVMKKLDSMQLAEASDLFFLWKGYSKTGEVEEARDCFHRCKSLCKIEENKAIEILLDEMKR